MSRGRASILISLAAAFAVGGGWLISQLTGEKDVTRLEAGAPALLLPAVYAACGTDETCVKNGIAETVNADPAGSVDAVLALFETPQAPRGGCHWAMHLLGQTLKPRTRAGEELGLDGRWHVCGYAVLHGAFEDVPLEGDTRTIGRAAFDVCLNGVLEGPLVGQCFHAIGHTIEMNLPGTTGEPYLRRAEAACIEGAWHARARMDTAAALKACVSGAHMRHRDTVIKPRGGRVVPDGEDPAALLPQCANSLVPYACMTLYMEDAFNAGETNAAAELLTWCATTSPSATEVCGYFYGLAARGIPGRDTSASVYTCTRDTGLTPGTRLACLRGVLERSGDEPLTTSRDTPYCRAVEALGPACTEILSVKPTYPEIAPLETALRHAGTDLAQLETTS